MGAVVRNSAGGVVAVRCMRKDGLTDPLVAEAWAGGQALKFGKELNLNNLILEGDAKVVVEAVLSNAMNESKIGVLVEDMKLLLQDFPRCNVCAVGRAANTATHVIARMAVNEYVKKTWLGTYPDCMHEIVLMESSSHSFD